MFAKPEKIFTGFHVATMAHPGSELARTDDGVRAFVQPDADYGAINNAAVGLVQGRIVWILPLDQLPPIDESIEVVHGHGRWLSPGLIDCHTHLVYGGNRSNEWEARLGGVSYAEIAQAGGGILSTVRSTRAASEDELVVSAAKRLRRLLAEGVTTVEIKSGYGLDLENELKMLRAARRLAAEFDVDVETTLLAAHAVPLEYKGQADEYVDLICREMIPAAVDFCTAVDAFCEPIAFDRKQTEKVFDAATKSGLKIKVHAEQLTHTGIAVAAANRGALSVDHLEFLSAADCQALGRKSTVATLLPGAYYCLHEKHLPPIAALRINKVPMAVATDCNPGSSPVVSLLLAGNMACNLFGLTPQEAFAGMTRHAAMALGLQKQIGTLEPGKLADFAVWDVASPSEILYGIGHQPCVAVYKAGRLRTGIA